jgi:hypothetical protein
MSGVQGRPEPFGGRNVASALLQGRSLMLSRRTIVHLVASSTVLTLTGVAAAKNSHHKDGHSLLGGKLKQNGKHDIDKAGQATVSATVNNGKVTTMAANHPQKGSLPVRKLKSDKKMAGSLPDHVRLAANGEGVQLAQVVVYYAWCFDDGLDEYCYWYPADDVVVDASWVVYVG